MGDRLTLDRALAVPGGTVRYGMLGPADAEPLFLLHGTPFSAQVWRRIAPLLAQQRRVVFHDLLGYGESDKPDGDVSLGVQNGAFAALVEAVGAERPDVIAHDFGGATALRAHLLDAVEYRRLLLVDPVAVRPWGSPFVQHVREHEAAFAGMPAYMHDALLAAYLQTAAARPLDPEALEIYAEPWRGETGQPAFYRQIAQMDLRFTDEIEPRYGAVRCPVTLLWGEADAWIPIERGEHLARQFPDVDFMRVPGSGHLMQEDRPEAILHAARRLLA